MMKIYIAGKITGDEQYRQKFQRAQVCLERQGFTVINPAELPEGLAPADYMRICFAMMDSADVVAFLPDYKDSRGAQLEWAWYQYVGKQTMYLEQMSFYPQQDHFREGTKMVGWISVEERLPECGERVLAASKGFCGEAYRTSAQSWYRHTGFPWRDAVGVCVTHWMPLPEPPEEGADHE